MDIESLPGPRAWITGSPAAVETLIAALSAAAGEQRRLRVIEAGWRGRAAGEGVIICLDIDAPAVRHLQGALGDQALVTSLHAIATEPVEADRVLKVAALDFAGDRDAAGAALAARCAEALAVPEHAAAALARERLRRQQAEAHARDLHALVQRLADLHGETVTLAREMTATAGTLSWVLARLTRPIRRRLALLGPTVRRLSGSARLPPAPPLSGRSVGVNVAGYLAAESGMGEAARASIRAFRSAGIPLALNNVEGPVRALDGSVTGFQPDNPHPFNLVHLNADNMAAFARSRGRAYFRSRYTIGYWFWELSRFREDWLPAFDLVHEVWVASRFVRDAVAEVAPVPVTCLPPCVTLPEVLDVGRDHFGLPPDRFVFLYVFDLSSQFERKNPLGLIRAFRRAGIERQALLVLKLTHAEREPDAVRAMHQAADGLPVRFIEGHVTRPELGALLRAADGYASLHRSEGFGLTMAEAMLLDKPVVATGYSGNLEYMSQDTAWLVQYRLVPLTRNHGPYLQGYDWAAPDEAHAAELLREVAFAPAVAAARARRGGDHARRLLSPEAAASRMVQRLLAIRDEPRAAERSRLASEPAVTP